VSSNVQLHIAEGWGGKQSLQARTQCIGAAGILYNPKDDYWMLAYGGPADRLDEYIRMGESTIIDCVKQFTRLIVELYGDEYMREPNQNDITRLLSVAEERGIPGMLGSIDCMH
jgi:hypothetical protein